MEKAPSRATQKATCAAVRPLCEHGKTHRLAQERQSLDPIVVAQEFAGDRFDRCKPQKTREMDERAPSVARAQRLLGRDDVIGRHFVQQHRKGV